MAAKAATSELLTLPDALQAPTREYMQMLISPLHAGLDLHEAKLREDGRDAIEGGRVRAARRLLKQLEQALPEAADE